MPKRNRQTLKESFRQGKKPSEQDFENLIDSTINILDDGLSKRADTGIGLAPLQGNETVMSIYREPGDEKAAWEIAIDKKGNLLIGRRDEVETTPLLTLRKDGHVELGEKTGEIHFSNQFNAPGRKGTFLSDPAKEVLANGKWQDITPELEGCWALEVIAGCGRRHSGKHALLVATAVHCFGQRAKITKTRSHYGMYGNRLCIRWVRKDFACKLQVKTLFHYGEGVKINYHITKLWDMPYMEEK